jgi:glycosyltransferase involved in cell wall biosynthesis
MPLHRLRAKLDPRLQIGFAVGLNREVRAIRRVIREREIDLVLVCGLVNPHAAIAGRREGVPVVWMITDSRAPAALRRLLMPLVERLASAVLFNGKALADLHLRKSGLKVPSFIFFPPVDTDRFVPSAARRNATRRLLGIPSQAPVVGMVANLNPQKGVEYFLRAASIIQQSRPETWFILVGAPFGTHRAYENQLQLEIARSGIRRDHLILTGGRDDVENYYPAMDTKLITSVPRSEGSTTTAIEAMACGVPVVTTNVGSVSEVVTDEITGLVVPPLDERAISEATLRILGNSSLAGRMGEAGRRRAIEHFTTEVCVETHVEAFETAIEHERSRRGGPRTNLAPK